MIVAVLGAVVLAHEGPVRSLGAQPGPTARVSQAAARTLRAGAARVDITPDGPIALEGYENPENRVSQGVHDRLYARAVALEVGSKRVLLVSCDLGSMMFGAYFLRLIQDRWRLQPDEVMLCATHTHSGPQISLNADYPHPNNLPYTKALERSLVEVTGRALDALAPARLAIGRGRSAVGVSRRKVVAPGRVEMAPNPDGASDPELLALTLSRPGKGPFAVLFDYASHSRSLRGTNRLVSGDIFGLAEQAVEQEGKRTVIAAGFPGASGDVDPASVVDSFDAAPGSEPPTVLLGRRLADDVLDAVRAAVAPARPITALRTASKRVILPPKTPGQSRGVDLVVTVLGDVALVGVDAELSVEVGLAIKRASPFGTTIVITNCNGWAGYLPTARQHEEGGYEAARTGFGPGAGEALVKEIETTLSRLREAR